MKPDRGALFPLLRREFTSVRAEGRQRILHGRDSGKRSGARWASLPSTSLGASGMTILAGWSFPASAVAGAMAFAPYGHQSQDGTQTLAVARERILNSRGHLREDFAVDHVVTLQLAKMLGEHFLGRAGDEPLQFAKAARVVFEIKENERLPFSADNFGGEFDGAILAVQGTLP